MDRAANSSSAGSSSIPVVAVGIACRLPVFVLPKEQEGVTRQPPTIRCIPATAGRSIFDIPVISIDKNN